MYALFDLYTIMCAFGVTFGNNVDYTNSSTNACIGPCITEAASLIHCSGICSQLQSCKGLGLNKASGTCCVCSTIGAPEQATDPEAVFYRTVNGQAEVSDLVNEIPDSHLTASSYWSKQEAPSRARLNTLKIVLSVSPYVLAGSWAAKVKSSSEYIQARFNDTKEVFSVKTQGRNDWTPLQCVTSYRVSYSIDCVSFSFIKESEGDIKTFPGNYDQDTIVSNALPESILAVCVRLYTHTFHRNPSMRVGIMGRDIE